LLPAASARLCEPSLCHLQAIGPEFGRCLSKGTPNGDQNGGELCPPWLSVHGTRQRFVPADVDCTAERELTSAADRN